MTNEEMMRLVEKHDAERETLIAELFRARSGETALRELLIEVLNSSTPHPVAHPSMWRAWRRANTVLGRPPDTHVIPTADKDLELRIMNGGLP